MRLQLAHLVKLVLIAAALGFLFFCMGYTMGEQNHKQKVVAALKAGKNHEAMSVLYGRQQSGEDVKSDPFFFLAKASVHLKNGNAEACQHSIDKALELLGK